MQADKDIAYLNEITTNAARFYVDGKPLHCHDDARNVDFKIGSSCLFIATADEFRRMSPNIVQDIFRKRHILVLDVEPNQTWVFDEECLNRLGPIDEDRAVHGKS